jgi:UDP-2,3-diacylglucosamine hydrolase
VTLKGTAYFISDAHLGVSCPGFEAREGHLLEFFDKIKSDAAYLFILGDLFDFWIEYRNAIRPAYFHVLHKLRDLIESGITIHYLAGNHDFAMGDFLERNIGINIHKDFFNISIQGKKLHLEHGDNVNADASYRLLRKVLRNPFNLKLFKLLHPDLGVWLAELFSGSSRRYFRRRYTENKRKKYVAAAQKIADEGNDIVMFGHTHTPEMHNLNGKIYCNTGEWIRRYTYATLRKGRLQQWQYLPGRNDLELTAGEPLQASATLVVSGPSNGASKS